MVGKCDEASRFTFVTLKQVRRPPISEKELVSRVRETIGAIAAPAISSGRRVCLKTFRKIMRRLLRKIADRDTDDLVIYRP